ncbi:MAG: type II secretion system F family protein [Actinobacteria bacterium]|nr:MAG: type II secretion system F family protein [Actinomycetota bacterium]
MTTFAFKAVDLAGVPTRGELDADDKQAVNSQLRAKGLIVLDIEEQKTTDLGDYFGRWRRVKSQELTVATRQLATMIQSGMSLLRALYVLEEQARSDKFREALTSIRMDVEAGIALSEALKRYPTIFNALYTAMVGAGEAGGILEETLERVADQLEKDDSLRRQIKAALMYPILISTFAVVVLLALVAFLVPVFEKVFKEFGGHLPAITQFTVDFSHIVTGAPYLIVGGAVGVVVGFRKWKKSSRGAQQWDRFKLKVPWKIGDLVQKVALARFARTFSALIGAGVPMLQAIDITGRTSGNSVIEKAMDAVGESVRGGGSLTTPMRAEPTAFPIMVTQMIAVGEETGALEQMLSKIADFYEDEVAAGLKALTSILEPLMIILVGAIVGFIVVAMYMPMFKVYDNIR